jgi:alpha-beta hydrolase superfamily lysophospholipase
VNLLDWDAEVEARTGCPNHQRVLGAGAALPGALLTAHIPTALIDQADYAGDGLPTLGLHGEADLISPLETVRSRYRGRLVTIAGGRHDVLNDLSHRTVAATIVLFLERLRLGAGLPEIARVAA